MKAFKDQVGLAFLTFDSVASAERYDRLVIAPAFSKVRYRGSTFRPFVRLSTVCVESGNKLHFFAAVVAVRMKPCIVIVIDTLFKQAP